MKDKGLTLYIDTTDFSRVTYALDDGGKLKKKSFKIDPHGSHKILSMLEKFLKSQKFSDNKADKSMHYQTVLDKSARYKTSPSGIITKIVACKGPGSYTGTRIGVTHALVLGFAWSVPVKFLDKEKFDKTLKIMKTANE